MPMSDRMYEQTVNRILNGDRETMTPQAESEEVAHLKKRIDVQLATIAKKQQTIDDLFAMVAQLRTELDALKGKADA